jgi:hypothetical protein
MHRVAILRKLICSKRKGEGVVTSRGGVALRCMRPGYTDTWGGGGARAVSGEPWIFWKQSKLDKEGNIQNLSFFFNFFISNQNYFRFYKLMC